MTRSERVRLETLERVKGFGAAHGALFAASSVGGEAFACVARAIEQLNELGPTKLLRNSDGRRTTAAARAALLERMRILARTARGVRQHMRPDNEAAPRCRLLMPGRVSDAALIATARGFLGEAEPIEAELIALGLPATFLADLRASIETFAQALETRRAGRAAVAAAQAGIEAAIADGFRALRTLDIVVLNTIGSDPVLLARWRRDRRVVEGRRKRKTPAPVAELASAP